MAQYKVELDSYCTDGQSMGLKSKKKMPIVVNDMGSSSIMDRSESKYEIDS
jgi:hypothetical protein